VKNSVKIRNICLDSFRANIYTVEPFRMIGLIDVNIRYSYGIERVTLAFYRSSGTYSGKIRGLWYPIVGIKTNTGKFTEFTDYINYVLTNTTEKGSADKGWLAKSLFFGNQYLDNDIMKGFSVGSHYNNLLKIGNTLKYLYETDNFFNMKSLDAIYLNSQLFSREIYINNRHSQRDNFEVLIEDIYNQSIF
jgi:hypothetical protein